MDYNSKSSVIRANANDVNNGIEVVSGIDFNSVWSGFSCEKLISDLNIAIKETSLSQTDTEKYAKALDMVSDYKEICEKIEALEAELASIPIYDDTKLTVINAANAAMRAILQAQITNLTNKKNELRVAIDSIISSFEMIETEISEINTTKIDNSNNRNIKPKNNSDISHRGYRTGKMIDNTAEAFILAGENGFWGCEADVRFDSNGELVCSHNTVKNGQNPTTFDEYLDICKEYGMTAIIDLKYEKGVGPADPNLSPAILKAIEDKGMIDSCILQTNNYTDVPYIRENSADARIWYLTDSVSENLDLIKENNVECVNISEKAYNSYQVRTLSEMGVDVCVWNVQTETTKERMLSTGAKYVMSDNVLGITPYKQGEYDFNGIKN